MKKCTKCQIEKPEQDFHKDKRTKSGLYSACKVCHCKQTTEYSKEYRTTHNGNEYMKEYRKTHNSSEYIRVYMKEYRQTEKNKVYRKEWFNQYRIAPQHRIEASMGAGIWQALKAKKAGRSWEVLVGRLGLDHIKPICYNGFICHTKTHKKQKSLTRFITKIISLDSVNSEKNGD